MDIQPTLQTIPVDCLIEIVSYLSLPECLELRTFSRHLKAAVDEHFRFADTLPVVLSVPNSHREGVELERYFQEGNLFWSSFWEFDNVTFGPSAIQHRCLTMFERPRILHKQAQHFRREDFLILPNTLTGIDGFIEFITKYMPKVSKLALLIDQEDYKNYEYIERIVSIYQKQLKVFSIDKTARSGWQYPFEKDGSVRYFNNRFISPKSFYIFLEKLEALEELFYFPKSAPGVTGSNYERKFVENMLRKLRVFYTSCTLYTSRFETIALVNEKLEELDCPWEWTDIQQYPAGSFRFPALKTLNLSLYHFVYGSTSTVADCMPNLRVLHVEDKLDIHQSTIQRLNNITNLERLHCDELRAVYHIGGMAVINQTIKHLVIENLPNHGAPAEQVLNKAKRALPFFAALETVPIEEPFMKLTVDELRALQ